MGSLGTVTSKISKWMGKIRMVLHTEMLQKTEMHETARIQRMVSIYRDMKQMTGPIDFYYDPFLIIKLQHKVC